jgi:hypothetical protein
VSITNTVKITVTPGEGATQAIRKLFEKSSITGYSGKNEILELAQGFGFSEQSELNKRFLKPGDCFSLKGDILIFTSNSNSTTKEWKINTNPDKAWTEEIQAQKPDPNIETTEKNSSPDNQIQETPKEKPISSWNNPDQQNIKLTFDDGFMKSDQSKRFEGIDGDGVFIANPEKNKFILF